MITHRILGLGANRLDHPSLLACVWEALRCSQDED